MDIYSQRTAPKGLKIEMTESGSPLKETFTEVGSFGAHNPNNFKDSSVAKYHFPFALVHTLNCYQSAWENASIADSEVEKGRGEQSLEAVICGNHVMYDATMKHAFNTSLHALKISCEVMLETWLRDNNWNTKLYR